VLAKPTLTRTEPISRPDFHRFVVNAEDLGMPAPLQITVEHGIWMTFTSLDDMLQWAELMHARVNEEHAPDHGRLTVDAYCMCWRGHYVNLRAPLPALPVRVPGAALGGDWFEPYVVEVDACRCPIWRLGPDDSDTSTIHEADCALGVVVAALDDDTCTEPGCGGLPFEVGATQCDLCRMESAAFAARVLAAVDDLPTAQNEVEA
jgi:hypothetical protein